MSITLRHTPGRTPRASRRRVAGVATLLALTLAATAAPAANAAPPVPDPDVSAVTVHPGTRTLPLESRLSASALASRRASKRPGAAGLPAATASVRDAMRCPVGYQPRRTIYTESFEDGAIPEPTYSVGWRAVRDAAATGAYLARSTLSPTSNPPSTAHAMLLPMLTTAGGRTMLSFDIKGNYGKDTAYVYVNEDNGWMDPSPTWGRAVLDVTDAAASAQGNLDIRFGNYPPAVTRSSTIDIDNVSVYSCVVPAASGVRGDYDGDGIADLLSTDPSGRLFLSAGRTTGTFVAPAQVGYTWTGFTHLGTIGDVTRDRRSDVIARRRDGYLYLYAGRGMGGFARAVPMGGGWNGFDVIVPMGDMNGDGLAEIIGRTPNGALWRYTISSTYKIVGRVQIAAGFHTLRKMFSQGDLNGDGRADLIGIARDGGAYAYYATATGRLNRAVKIGHGWNIFNYLVGTGDRNRDGRGDLIGRYPDGRIRSYFTGLGSIRTSVAAGSGYQRFTWIY